MSAVAAVQEVLPDIQVTALSDLQLLGSPLYVDGISEAARKAVETISVLCDQVRHLDCHTGLVFLAHFVSAPIHMYLLRSSPLFENPSNLLRIDEIVKTTLSEVINVDISGGTWRRTSLPRRHGGLGIRSIVELTLPCYISSMCAASPLIASICPEDDEGGHRRRNCR